MNQDHQEKVLEYRILLQQFQKLQQNVEAIHQHIEELKKLQENLQELSQTKADTETLIPLGSGIFLKGKILDTQNLIMNVGSNICLEKSLTDAMKTVQQQATEVETLLSQLEEETLNVSEQLETIKAELKE